MHTLTTPVTVFAKLAADAHNARIRLAQVCIDRVTERQRHFQRRAIMSSLVEDPDVFCHGGICMSYGQDLPKSMSTARNPFNEIHTFLGLNHPFNACSSSVILLAWLRIRAFREAAVRFISFSSSRSCISTCSS